MKNKLLVSACLMDSRCGITVRRHSWRRRCPAGSRRAAGDPLPGAGGRSPRPDCRRRSRQYRRRCACRTGADRGSDGRDVTGHYQLAARLALSAAREAAVRRRYSPTAALPAAASLSMTVPFADGAKRAPAWPPTYLRTASRYFPMGKSRSCSRMAQEQDDDSV